jgi:hypothetical protein
MDGANLLELRLITTRLMMHDKLALLHFIGRASDNEMNE